MVLAFWGAAFFDLGVPFFDVAADLIAFALATDLPLFMVSFFDCTSCNTACRERNGSRASTDKVRHFFRSFATSFFRFALALS